MRIHALQHVPFEDLANVKGWAKEKGHTISRTLLFREEELPPYTGLDWLVILGGPMNIYEERQYPWLVREKRFIEKAIAGQKIVLGICLGSQLIADLLGGKVYKSQSKEIGWFPVSLTAEAKKSRVFNTFPGRFPAFHWHGDTFALPSGCQRIAESQGCANQVFEYNGRVIGLQFHLESSRESIRRLIQNCGDELHKGPYIQTPEEILSQQKNLQSIKSLMNLLLDKIENEFGGDPAHPCRKK